jgi:hypothetical protein
MSRITSHHKSKPQNTSTTKASTINLENNFIVEQAEISKSRINPDDSGNAEVETIVLPYDPIPVAMLLLWSSGIEPSLANVYDLRPELAQEYDPDLEDFADQEQVVDEVEAFYWLYKLGHDVKILDLQIEAMRRYLNALNIGPAWLAGELWDRIDDVYSSEDFAREALHSVTKMLVKKFTLLYAVNSERRSSAIIYRRDLELLEGKVYELEWQIVRKCWEPGEALGV